MSRPLRRLGVEKHKVKYHPSLHGICDKEYCSNVHYFEQIYNFFYGATQYYKQLKEPAEEAGTFTPSVQKLKELAVLVVHMTTSSYEKLICFHSYTATTKV